MAIAFKSSRRPSRQTVSAHALEMDLAQEAQAVPVQAAVQAVAEPIHEDVKDEPVVSQAAIQKQAAKAPEPKSAAVSEPKQVSEESAKPAAAKSGKYSTRYTADINVPIKMLRNPNAGPTSNYRVDVKIGDGYGQLSIPHDMMASTAKNGRSVHFYLPLNASFEVTMKNGRAGGKRAGQKFSLSGLQVRQAFEQFFGAFRRMQQAKSGDYGQKAESSLSVNSNQTQAPSSEHVPT